MLKKRKKLAIITAGACILSIMPIKMMNYVNAEDTSIGKTEIIYETTDIWCGLIYTITADGVLTVSKDSNAISSHESYLEETVFVDPRNPFAEPEYYQFNMQPELEHTDIVTTIKFDNDITNIPDYIFATNIIGADYELTGNNEFSNLKTVILSETNKLGKYSFYGMEIENLIIPSKFYGFYRNYIYYLDMLNVFIYDKQCYIDDIERTIQEKTIIHGYKGSTAHAYAEKYGRKFVPLDDEPDVTTVSTTTPSETTETTITTISSAVSDTTSAITSNTTTTITTPDITINLKGDANGDGKLTANDAAFIARKLAENKADELPKCADFNEDGRITAHDAALIANYLAKKYIRS